MPLLDVLQVGGDRHSCKNSRHLEEDLPSCLHWEDLLWSMSVSKCEPHKVTSSTQTFVHLWIAWTSESEV